MNNLKEGDIIYARRYKNIKEKNKIPKGHREGPFVIIRRTKKLIIALGCTSNEKISKNYYFYKYKIIESSLGLHKNSYVLMNIINNINKKTFIKKIGELTEEDFIKINKYLYLYLKKNNLKILHIKNLYLPPNIGDIIKIGKQLGYIYKKDNNFIYYILIEKGTKEKYNYLINGKYYYFHLKVLLKMEINSKYQLENIINDSKTNYEICNIATENEELIKNKNELIRGKVIWYEDNLYYIFGENGKSIDIIKIYGQSNKGEIKVKLSNKWYYTNFEENSILKNENIKIHEYCTLKEIKDFREIKRFNSKKKKKKL